MCVCVCVCFCVCRVTCDGFWEGLRTIPFFIRSIISSTALDFMSWDEGPSEKEDLSHHLTDASTHIYSLIYTDIQRLLATATYICILHIHIHSAYIYVYKTWLVKWGHHSTSLVTIQEQSSKSPKSPVKAPMHFTNHPGREHIFIFCHHEKHLQNHLSQGGQVDKAKEHYSFFPRMCSAGWTHSLW